MDIKRIESFVNSIDFLNACNALELHQLCVRLELCIWHRRRIVLHGPPPPLSPTHSLVTSIRNVYFQYSKYNPVMKCARAKGRPHYEYTLFFFILLHLIYAFLNSLLILCSIQCGIMCKWNVDQVNGRHFYFYINERKNWPLYWDDVITRSMTFVWMIWPKDRCDCQKQYFYSNTNCYTEI